MPSSTLFPAALALLLAAAAAEDVWRLRISNITVIAVIALFACAAVTGEVTGSWQSHIGAGAIALGVGVVLFAVGAFGGGDAKLLAAAALWVDVAHLPRMLLAVAISGFLLLAFAVVGRRVLSAAVASGDPKHLLNRHSRLPYGVAIAAGTLLTMAQG
jgi:prepilin peptidase CpaA